MYHSLKQRLLTSEFSKNLTLVLSGNIAAKSIGILAAPIITRIYSPEEYGVFSVFVAVVAIVGALSTLRYATVIPLIKSDKAVEAMLKLCFLVVICISVFSCLVIFIGGSFLVESFSAQRLEPYMWFLPLAFFATGLYQTLSSWAVREKRFKIITQTTVFQSVSSALSKIVLGLLSVKPAGLLVGVIVQEAAGSLRLLKNMLAQFPEFFKTLNWRLIKAVAGRYKKFPLIQSWSQLLLALGAQLPVLLIGYFYGIKVAGIFGLAQSMISLPMNLIGQSVSQVYYAEIARIGISNSEKILKLSIKVIKKMFLVGLLPVFFLVFLGPVTFEIFFGNEWKDAGVYSQVLAALVLFRFISSPIASVLNVFEKQLFQLSLNFFRIILVLLVFSGSFKFDIEILGALSIYSVVISFYYIALVLSVLFLMRRNRKTNYE